MGKQAIGEFLEKNSGKWYTPLQVTKELRGATKENVTRALKAMIKREGYEVKLKPGIGPFGVKMLYRYNEVKKDE